MTTTATYLDDLSRVRIAFDGFPSSVDYALVERSTDGITWSTVRGGDAVAVTAGAGHVDDYEFAAGVLNTYRVSGVDSGPIIGVPAAGAAASANNAAVVPALPAGVVEGDLLLCYAVARKTGFSPTLVPPAGWTRLSDYGDLIFYGKRAGAAETAPTVGITGGAAGVDVIAQVMAFHNADLPQTSTNVVGTTAQNITLPVISSPPASSLNLWLAKKDSSWTSAAPSTTYATIGATSSALGSGAATYWDYTVQGPSPVLVPARTLTVTGGTSAANVGIAYTIVKAPYVTRQTAAITPVLDSAWIKNPQRPSLNRKVTVSGISDITRPTRTNAIEVVGRTLPVAISDVQGSRRLTLTVMTRTLAEAADFDQAFASGLPVFLQAPELTAVVPTLYASVGEVTLRRGQSVRAPRRFFDLPLTECAAPASTVYGDTYTWSDVISDYATWADVVADVATWSNLIDKVSDAEVVVP
ncbi:hypothetical protein DMP23_00275 [Amycolatopsis sp. A1MSW2902]|uniref:hypothetical protein n=1 Tax=Amycolatopsis sp. A1MSW2902 TaxID=687413 RepID=UPI00307DE58E